MTKTSPLRGKISPYELFFLLFVSRISVSLTYAKSVSQGKISADLLAGIFFASVLTGLFSLPVCFCIKKGRNPSCNKFLRFVYAAYFLYFAAVNISRFSYFAYSETNSAAPAAFFVIIVSAAVAYCASSGIEPLGRFASFCAVLILLAVAAVLVFNIKNFHLINFYPLVKNSGGDIFFNSLLMSSNSVEPVLLLVLSKKTNSKVYKPYFASVAAAYAVIFVLIAFCIAVLGDNSNLQSYPIFTLFQMASIGSFSRLDIIHASFWILALVVKASALIAAASDCAEIFGKKSNKKRSVVFTLAAGLGAVAFCSLPDGNFGTASKSVSLALFFAFAVIIPIAYLIFGGNKNAKNN